MPVKQGPLFAAQHGMNQQTPATQHLIVGTVGNGAYAPVRAPSQPRKKKGTTTRRARARTGVKKRRPSPSKRASGRSRSALVKGSAAAKRRMAALRALRKK